MRPASFCALACGGPPSTMAWMMLMSASLLQKGDVALAFWYSEETLIVLEAVPKPEKTAPTSSVRYYL
jgi:hypothetical protein